MFRLYRRFRHNGKKEGREFYLVMRSKYYKAELKLKLSGSIQKISEEKAEI